MPEYKCTPGHEDRCMNAKSKNCTCGCGGHNHGIADGSKAGEEKEEKLCKKSKGNIIGFISDRGVYINNNYLSPKKSQKAYNHSPDGFNWGYGGSGPAQLALGVLLEMVDKNIAMSLYQKFKWEVIAELKQGQDFLLKISDIKKWLKDNGIK